jgi:hypothetical protein
MTNNIPHIVDTGASVMNTKELRDEFAARVMAGICAGDWKFDTSEKTWDEVAAKRAYEIADAMMKEREISNV